MNVKKMLGKVVYKENLTENTWLLGIELEEEAVFAPGQYVSLKVSKEGLRRSYSIANTPGRKSIELVVDLTPMGVGSKYILSLKVGDLVELLGFLGKFVINEEILKSSKEIIMVATGCGIVPFRPMIDDLLSLKAFNKPIKLIWGMRHEKDLYWIKEMDKYQREYDNFHFEIALSKPEGDWPGIKGHVGNVIENISCDWNQTAVFLCGNPEMIIEIKEILKNKGVVDDKIFFERYA